MVPLAPSCCLGCYIAVFCHFLVRYRVQLQAHCLLLGQIDNERRLYRRESDSSGEMDRSRQPTHRFRGLEPELADGLAPSLELAPKTVAELCLPYRPAVCFLVRFI